MKETIAFCDICLQSGTDFRPGSSHRVRAVAKCKICERDLCGHHLCRISDNMAFCEYCLDLSEIKAAHEGLLAAHDALAKVVREAREKFGPKEKPA